MMVVLYHCNYMYYSHAAEQLAINTRQLSVLAMSVDIFFVISGFIMMLVSDRKDSTAISSVSFMADRIVRVVPVYWFYTALVALVGLAAPSLLRSATVNPETFIKSLFFIPFFRENGIPQPLLGVGWTLNYEMVFYVTFALLLPLGQWTRVAALAGVFGVLFAVGLAVGQDTIFGTFFSQSIVFTFVGGMILYLMLERWGPLPPASAAVLAAVAVAYLGWIDPADANWGRRLPYWGLPAMAIVYAALSLPQMGGRPARILERIGDASYSIYLTHIFTISGLYFAFSAVWRLDALPFTVVTFLVSIAIGCLAYVILERPMLRGARRIADALLRRRSSASVS